METTYNDVQEQKKQLRKRISALLKALPEAYRASASDRIQEKVLASQAYRDASRVFLYLSMPTEPETGRIIRDALSNGKAVYVPKCVSKTEMLAVRIRSTDELAPGAYGILEPITFTETIEPDALDLILVPCVSASTDGKRLGHGAGYYDRFLCQNADKTICLCFGQALCADIPTGETDVRMRYVISEIE